MARQFGPSLGIGILTLTIASSVLPTTVRSQSVPVWVDSAIELGQGKSRVEPVKVGRRAGILGRLVDDSGIGFFTTPYLRVALASRQARERSQPFGRSNVASWMLTRVVTFYLPTREDHLPEHVVIRPVGDDRPTVAIQPTRKREMDPDRDSIIQVRETRAYTALVAEFPLSALKVGHEFYMTYRRTSDDHRLRFFTGEITADMVTLSGCPVACR